MEVNPMSGDITSIGALAAQLVPGGGGYRMIQGAALELNILPAATIDGVPYFSLEQCERIMQRLARVEAGEQLPTMFDPRAYLPVLRRPRL
jgi:hypothetical protein